MINSNTNNLLFKASPFIGVYILSNYPTFTIIAATNDFLNAYQKKEEAVIGKSFFEIFNYSNNAEGSNDAEALIALFTATLKNKMPKKIEGFYLSSKTTNLNSFKTKNVSVEVVPVINESGIPQSIIVTLKDTEGQVNSNSLAYQNNEYYQSIVENSLNAFFLAKPNGVLLEANKAACNLFGYTIEEFRQIGRQGIIDHSEADINQKIKERNTTGKIKTELIGIKKNGQRFPIEVYSVIFLNENGEQRSSTSIIDITDRKKAEDALKKSEKYLLEAQKMAKMGSWNFDFKDDKLTWSEGLYEVFGVQKETFLETYGSFVNLIVEEDKAFVAQTSKLAQLTGKPFNIEYRITTPNGENRIIEEFGYSEKNTKGEIVRLYGTAQDITERKQIERVLQSSEKKYKTIFEDNPLPMFIWDFETLNIIDCNNEALLKYGYTRDEFLKLNIRDIRPKEDVAKINASTANETTYEKVHKKVWRHLKKNGELMLMEVTGHLLDHNGRRASLVMLNDVTEKKKLEVLLNKSSRLAAVGSWEIDVLNNSVYWSEITKEIREVEPDFVPDLATGISFFKEGVSKETITKRVKDCIENGTPWDEELQIFTHKGNLKWIRTIGEPEMLDGKCVKIYGSFQDITERKKAAIKLAESENRFRTILEAEPECVKLLGPNNELLMMNASGLEMIEADTEEQVLGKSVLGIILPEHRAAFTELTKKVFNGGSGKLKYEIKGFKGTKRWLETTATPLKNEQGEVISLLEVTRDITISRQYENSLKQLNETLQKNAQQLAISNKELEQFAYIASHDLQEPLRMVTSFLTLLEKKYSTILDDKGKQYIQFAADGAVRMRQIILDLLEFSRAGRLESEMDDVNINEVVSDIIFLNSDKIEESHAKIEVGTLPTLKTHKIFLNQVFQNLIGNALKYKHNDKAPLIKINCEEIPGYWKFSIKDNGIGIDEQYFEKIFIIFNRLHNKTEYSGTGIGLAIVKKIINTLNGKIWVESENGKGTTFYFTIPK